MFVGFLIWTLCKRVSGPGSHFLYCDPNAVPPCALFLFCVNMGLSIVWRFLWQYEHVWPASVFSLLLVASIFAVIFFATKKFEDSVCHKMYNHRLSMMINIYGLAGWYWIILFVNFGACLIFGGPEMANIDVSTALLVLLLVTLLVWYGLELTIFAQQFMAGFGHHVTFVVALSVILAGNAQTWNRNSIITIVTLVVACIMFIGKIVYLCYIQCYKGAKQCSVKDCEMDKNNQA